MQFLIMDRPVVIRSSDPALLAVVAQACAGWPVGEAGEGPPIQLEMRLGDTASGEAMDIEVDGPCLRMTGPGLDCGADARTLTAVCRLPRNLVDPPGRLAGEVIDTLLLFLLARSGRTPVHAAGVMCGETAVLLAGPSGSGKSTLGLAAMARGLPILSDDTVYIQLQPRLRIWGFPRPLHVFPADAPGFIRETRLRAGKLKAAVPLAPWRGPPVAEAAAVVLLRRGEAIRLEPVAGATAEAALSHLEPGFDLLRRESSAAVATLTSPGAWRLTLTRDPAAAVEALLAQFGSALTTPA